MPPSALDRLGKWGAFDYYSSSYKLFSNFSCTHLTIGLVSLQHLCILSILCFLKSTMRQQNGLHIVVFWSSLQKKAWSTCHIGYAYCTSLHIIMLIKLTWCTPSDDAKSSSARGRYGVHKKCEPPQGHICQVAASYNRLFGYLKPQSNVSIFLINNFSS